MVKNNTNNKIDILNLSVEIITKLKEISKKQNISIDQLIVKLLDSFNKNPDPSDKKGSNSKRERARESMPEDLTNRKIDIQADLTKLFTFNTDLIELLRRIAQSIENIERSHEQGWSDQRIDLGGISKKLDKLL